MTISFTIDETACTEALQAEVQKLVNDYVAKEAPNISKECTGHFQLKALQCANEIINKKMNMETARAIVMALDNYVILNGYHVCALPIYSHLEDMAVIVMNIALSAK